MVTCCPGGCKARRATESLFRCLCHTATQSGAFSLAEGVGRVAHAEPARSDALTGAVRLTLARSQIQLVMTHVVQTHDDNTWAKRTPEQGARAIAWAFTSPKVPACNWHSCAMSICLAYD